MPRMRIKYSRQLLKEKLDNRLFTLDGKTVENIVDIIYNEPLPFIMSIIGMKVGDEKRVYGTKHNGKKGYMVLKRERYLESLTAKVIEVEDGTKEGSN